MDDFRTEERLRTGTNQSSVIKGEICEEILIWVEGAFLGVVCFQIS